MAGFTITDNDVAEDPNQSIWFSTDIAILVAGHDGVGVISGCDVTAQASPDMTVHVAAGTIQPVAGAAGITVTAGNLTVPTADGSLPRLDLVSASASGTKTYTAGTAASAPKPPPLPSGHVGLAIVFVGAADTAIGSAEITDKRLVVPNSRAVVTRTATFDVDGGGAAPTAGVVQDVYIPLAGTIVSWAMASDISGSAVVDIWKKALASGPPTVTETITASAKPTLSSAQHADSTGTPMTGWTTSVAAGDVLRFHLDSASTLTKLSLWVVIAITV